MAEVVWHVTMSLDGFIAGPDDAMEWVFEHSGPNAVADEIVSTTGAVLAGRRSYDVGKRDAVTASRGIHGVYGRAWTGPQFVLTHNPPDPETDSGVTFLSGDVSCAVARALATAGGKNVVLIGATVARECLALGLVDEIVVHLAPVLLGDGIRLFESPACERFDLERTSVGESGQLTDLRFRVKKNQQTIESGD
jgi:dihydrofolate reductase